MNPGLGFLGPVPRFESQTTGPQTNNGGVARWFRQYQSRCWRSVAGSGRYGWGDWELEMKQFGNLGCDHLTPIGWVSGWWFQIFFIFTPTWGNDPII